MLFLKNKLLKLNRLKLNQNTKGLIKMIKAFTQKNIDDINEMVKENWEAGVVMPLASTDSDDFRGFAIQLNEFLLRVEINPSSEYHDFLFTMITPDTKASDEQIGSSIYSDKTEQPAEATMPKTKEVKPYVANEFGFYTNPVVMGTITKLMYNVCHYLYAIDEDKKD